MFLQFFRLPSLPRIRRLVDLIYPQVLLESTILGFGISSNLFNYSRAGNNANIPSDELDSEDDIVKFSPASSFKISLLRLTGSAGVEIAQFLKNSDKSYVIPITTLILDFDETLSKSKRISNNAKIRFDATFDVGQQVGASVLEQDLVSYTYLTTGINVRYNHSSKFGVGAGTNYTYQWYQKEGSTALDLTIFQPYLSMLEHSTSIPKSSTFHPIYIFALTISQCPFITEPC